MALSGKVGASLVMLNSAACTPSLNSETLRNMPSAVSPSIMSQPVKKASAPRLAAPRRKPRRLASGISLAASFIRSFGSTPGMILRWRIVAFLPSGDHCTEPFRDDQRERNMHNEKSDDRGHSEEMHVACSVVASEQSGQLLKLDRFPDR